jgi:hypothetical protein
LRSGDLKSEDHPGVAFVPIPMKEHLMRKLIVFGLVAVATVVFAGNMATAAVLGGGGYKDGKTGKNSSKYCIYIKNKDHYNGMACWIYEQGNDYYPSTLGELHSEMVYIDPYGTGHSEKMKKGYYEVCLFCAHDLYGPSYHEIDQDFYDEYTIDKVTCHLDYGDKHLCCDKYGLWYEGHDSYGDGGYGGGDGDGYGGGGGGNPL